MEIILKYLNTYKIALVYKNYLCTFMITEKKLNMRLG